VFLPEFSMLQIERAGPADFERDKFYNAARRQWGEELWMGRSYDEKV
jgi:hypothetical protein